MPISTCAARPRAGALENVLKINASCFLETDADQITTGRRTPVEGTPMDFREPKPLGRDINADYEPRGSATGTIIVGRSTGGNPAG